MNKKISNPKEIMEFYDELISHLKSLGLNIYVPQSYFHDQIAVKFNVSKLYATKLLNKQLRLRETTSKIYGY